MRAGYTSLAASLGIAGLIGLAHSQGILTPPYVLPFSSVTYGQFAIYQGNGACGSNPCISGDTFFNTWADDGKVYALTNDTPSGWNATGASANMMVSTLAGTGTNITGTLVNAMTQFGGETQSGSDGATWKTSGIVSVNGTLYIAAFRQLSGLSGSLSAQIIKSTDHGVTWTPTPATIAQPFTSPMFGSNFGMPVFIQYGQDYQTQTVDSSGTYVYAMSTYYPNNYNVLYLGRVSSASISNLSASDWSFYQGGNGFRPDAWGPLATAYPVLDSGAGCACHEEPTIQYLPAFQKYVMIDGHYPTPTTTIDNTSRVWDLWIGEHPWGEWTKKNSVTWSSPGTPTTLSGYGFYFPSIMQNSVSGGSFTVFTTGDFNVASQYTMYIVPTAVT